ncbi:MAG: LysE family transporter [Chloroflexi bacterium]|nr:LysE family transporter [Chloroflexota bacterium]
MTFLALAFSLGLSAGLAPGPLFALVIQRSLQFGLKSGIRVALAPLLSDLPIVVISLWLVGRLPQRALDAMLVIGGLFVIWLGVDSLRHGVNAAETEAHASVSKDLWQAVLANVLNPHPYLFWALVGAPIVIRAWRVSPAHAAIFIIVFYTLLVGSKIALAFFFSRARGLPERHQRWLIHASSWLLLGVGAYMLYSAAINFGLF